MLSSKSVSERARWGLLVFVGTLASCQLATSWTRASDLAGGARPNILLAIADDQSFPHASAYGDRVVRTPTFDRVARAGVLFTQAIAPSPGCSPCRAALLTGRYPWQLEAAGTHGSDFPRHLVTFPEVLSEAGYFVGYTGKGWGPGNWQNSGRSHNPAGPAFNEHRLKPPAGISRTDYAANFREFLSQRPAGQPFCFWYGGHEPHRAYGAGLGAQSGKQESAVELPPFLPDADEVRNDVLDYYREIEWFDDHLGQMLDILEARGELDRTLVIVTSDNGMPFPRAKANCYEYGIHMPLAMGCWNETATGRTVDDLVSLIDLAPTILEVAGVEHPHASSAGRCMMGQSLRGVLSVESTGVVEPQRARVFSARERHSSSRYQNLGYPQRAMRTHEYLLIRNFHPERWPAGDPRKYEPDGTLGPPHGGYHDIDASPTLEYLISRRDDPVVSRYFRWAVDRRPAVELYDVKQDPGCLLNLAADETYKEMLERLLAELDQYLRDTGDPRMGSEGEVFETYPRHAAIRTFPAPAQ